MTGEGKGGDVSGEKAVKNGLSPHNVQFFNDSHRSETMYSFSKYHFGEPGSEENISRSTHTIHTGIDSTCN
jgi:hypothetical protein